MTARRSIRLLIPIAILFFLIRLVYLRQLEGSPLLELLTLDAKYYHDWAARLVQGLGHPPGPFFLSPLYPTFLAGIYTLVGSPSPTSAILFQIFLSVGTLVLLFFAVRRLFDKTTAIVSSLLALFYAPWLYFDGMLLTGSLILFLNAALLLLLAYGMSVTRGKGWLWLMAGIVAGLSSLARPTILLFVLVLVVYLILRREETLPSPRRLSWPTIGVFILGVLAALSLVIARNMATGGSMLLTTSSAGINFYIGNRAGALGTYEELPWLEASDPQTEVQRYREEAQRRTGRSLTLEQASRFWMAQGFHDIAGHPGPWLKTLLRKLWLTVQDSEIRTNLSFAATRSFCPILRLLPLTWGFLFPLAIAGLFFLWRHGWPTRLLALYLAAYLLVNLIFFSASEYRFPMILALLPLAAGFFVELFRELRQRRFLRVDTALGIYLILLVVANFPSPLRARLTSPAMDFFNLGSEAINRGQIDGSIPLFMRALAERPDFPDAHLELARSLWQVGNYDEARREFEVAGMAPPDTLHGTPLERIIAQVRALSEEECHAQAMAFLEELFPEAEAAPVEILVQRAFLLERLGQFEEAASLYIGIGAREPENPEWPYRAALAMRRAGNAAACDSLLSVALGIQPAYAPARIEIALNALSRADTARALSELAELRRIRIPIDSLRWKVEDLARRIAPDRGNE
ncbi:MAG: tetratricopeptide repeat protein [bacterium]